MASSSEQLTHEEIWDDSILVNTWDEALQEYKKYHSVEATGGDVNKILQEASGETEMPDATPSNQGPGSSGEKATGVASPLHQEDGGVGQGAVPRHVEASNVKNADILIEDQRAREGEEEVSTDVQGPVASNHEQYPVHGEEQGSGGLPSQTVLPPGLSPIPQNFVGGAGNEVLRNLMMSWYYAGYYTGLYEGQQQQQQKQRDKN
ncbi:hypothetical protein L873DRAFT_1306638 [Choiromyces venosus 120613-1]|uniref:Survival Motor Neuron Gemin2-binding domain-containing protein n=1 Tax=Choiromyces venosus 120613-1 TaxID=1336337 RepID=A0A3N4JBB4_9PEZI|nr:hypothetical protein L873DRAFT_1306638 [Choiromyces venosus 120613-1]